MVDRIESSPFNPMDHVTAMEDILLHRVSEVFQRQDKNVDGLDFTELRKALKMMVPKSVLECDINRWFEQLTLGKGDEENITKKEVLDYIHGKDVVQKAFAAAVRDRADTERGKKVKVLFRMYDKTDDGFISMGELQKMLKGLVHDFTGEEIQVICADLDKIKDGNVSFDEFMEWVSGESDVAAELRRAIDRTTGDARTARIKATFQQYDRSGDGQLEIPELHMALQTLGSFTNEEVKNVCADLDKNGDGSVSYKEFANWISSAGGSKEVIKAKAILAPTDSDGLEAVFYNFCGPGHLTMDSVSFVKLCRDCKFLDNNFDETQADLLFHRIANKKTRRIELEQFDEVRQQMAEKKGITLEAIYDTLIKVWRPPAHRNKVTVTREFTLASRPLGEISGTPRSNTTPRRPKSKDGSTPRRYLPGIVRLPVIKNPQPVDNSELWKVFGFNSPAGRALMRAYPPKDTPRNYYSTTGSGPPTSRSDNQSS